MPNEKSQKMVALNYERIQFWMAKGANVSEPVAELLG
jgi:ribosomal protein S16